VSIIQLDFLIFPSQHQQQESFINYREETHTISDSSDIIVNKSAGKNKSSAKTEKLEHV
jgi:hypothetical protein